MSSEVIPPLPAGDDDSLSPHALETLLAHRDRFLSFVQRRVSSPAVAEEILQDAFVRGFERGGALRDDETVIAWFYRVIRNAVIDRGRREDARGRALEAWAGEVAASDTSSNDADACQCVMPLVDTLKPEYAAAIRAVDLEGGDVGALAIAAQITPNNASVRLHRAREALGRKLRKVCGACAVHACVDCSCAHRDAPPAEKRAE